MCINIISISLTEITTKEVRVVYKVYKHDIHFANWNNYYWGLKIVFFSIYDM